MAELLELARTLRNFRELTAWYHITEHDALCIDDHFYAMTPQPALEKAIGQAIVSPTEMADTASDTLYDIRRKIRGVENSIRDKLDALTKSQQAGKVLQDAVVSIRNGRFVVPVKAEYRGEVGGVIHDVSSSGSTLFVEPTAVVEANAKILQLRNQEQAEVERILAAFSAQAAELEPCSVWAMTPCCSWTCCWRRQSLPWSRRPCCRGAGRLRLSPGACAPPAYFAGYRGAHRRRAWQKL